MFLSGFPEVLPAFLLLFLVPSAPDSPVTVDTASCHKLGVTAETGARQGQDSTCHNGPASQNQPELAVRAHRTASSPTVSGSLREQTGGGEEERTGGRVGGAGR
ncbi:hypothetical protein NQZ68_039787 [Dissostichus eleginoides]|nr:hypothetical protein NQZ68_039787 [Dissostichus eleginoides]